ncbi:MULTISPECIES: nitroreductase family protein [unclassified Paenibacillus]|uniref:nitroreductase family protein n=1 Tax=unclassified Paenibacillus TaxID=185978 RepID=UPI002405F69B|nr:MULTISPECIES: nitroreductase family protein [unclassified Paenibacillus]MDF9842431.1 nitroreductase [Paenibacillus sp. PastF-2]MDF9849021.1 nitroreductase [Paenibacillus sp. PastM-2]MDF9855591.1 nitroreductase [Paenibacillus sp. PastF-1]MDH6480863.1 nitroreductase [Paenibacillus sp. PastH-2]MDH6508285.1 nitroreductase [Paenibacillus sp. PastM-3]
MTTELKVEVEFSKVIRERHSVRKYDPSWNISDEEIKAILDDAILAPSSSNLQPWRFIVITDPELKEQLLPIANNQQQVVDASATIAVIGDIEAYRNAEKIWEYAEAAGYVTAEVGAAMAKRSRDGYSSLPVQKLKEIALIDGGLVSMQLMLAAKAKGYDTVPMGGFHPAKFRELFNIPERYETVMLIALGKAAAEGRSTARLPLEEVVQWNGFEG